MIILDTSGLFALADEDSRQYEPVRHALQDERGPFLLSPFVVAEMDYLLTERIGVEAEVAFLRLVTEGAYRLEPFDADDMTQAVEVIERYRDLRIGLADASIVVLAARHRTNRILTFDERHFRAVRPLQGGRRFRLLPTDA